jgi:hypothetical protein
MSPNAVTYRSFFSLDKWQHKIQGRLLFYFLGILNATYIRKKYSHNQTKNETIIELTNR